MSDRLTDDDLAAIKARVGAATRKGWVVEEIPETGECRITSPVGVTRDIKVVAPGGLTFNNADFIAHARTDLPEAIRIIREQDAEIERLREFETKWTEFWSKFRNET